MKDKGPVYCTFEEGRSGFPNSSVKALTLHLYIKVRFLTFIVLITLIYEFKLSLRDLECDELERKNRPEYNKDKQG